MEPTNPPPTVLKETIEYNAIDQMAKDPEFWGNEFDDLSRIEMLDAIDNDFATLPIETKASVYDGIKREYEPTFINTMAKPAANAIMDFTQNQALPFVQQVGLEAAIPVASAAKGLSAGYLDFTDPLKEQLQQVEQQRGVPEQLQRANRFGTGFEDKAFELGGMLAPIGLTSKAVGLGAQAAARVPQLGRVIASAPKVLQSGVIPAMAREATAFGAYEGLRKPEEGETRLGNAAMGAGLGAAFPAAGKFFKSALQRVLSRPAQRAVGLSQMATPELQQLQQAQAVIVKQEARYNAQKKLLELYAKALQESEAATAGSLVENPIFKTKAQSTLTALNKLADDIQRGVVQANELEIAQIAKNINKLQETIATGKDVFKKGEIKRVQQFAERVRKAATRRTERSAAKAQAKATAKAEAEKMAAATKAAEEKLMEGEVTATGEAAEAVAPKEPVKAPSPAPEKPALKGSVQEMLAQGLKESGLSSFDEAKTLIGKLEAMGKVADDPVIKNLQAERKALGNKRDAATKKAKAEIDAKIQAVKDERNGIKEQVSRINQNIKDLINAGWDGQSAVVKQTAVDTEKQLTREAVEDLVTDKKILNKVDEAMQNGVSIRGEFTSEITGSTDQAAKITRAGNVKVPLSTFTPTHYTKVKKFKNPNAPEIEKLNKAKKALGNKRDEATKQAKANIDAQLDALKEEYPAVVGYNEQGYSRLHYFNSPEGSGIANVKVLPSEQFTGSIPNVYLGARDFKAADVLKRLPDVTSAIKTSEAITNAKAMADFLKPEFQKTLSKTTQNLMKNITKKGQFTAAEVKMLKQQMAKTPEDMKQLCNLFGLI